MKIYTVAYKRFDVDNVHMAYVQANSKEEAYDKAVYDIIAELPYSAWVTGYHKKDGTFNVFNTFEGKPY